MLPLRELPLSVFPLSGVGCGAATRRLYPTHHLRLFICFFFAPAKGLPYIWSSVCCSYAKEKTNFPFFFSSALYLDEYALIQYYMPLSLEKASSKLEIRLEQDTNHLHMNVVRVFL